jgi:hypothetical protein
LVRKSANTCLAPDLLTVKTSAAVNLDNAARAVQLHALEQSWGFGLHVWRERRLMGEWYRFRIHTVLEFDGNIHIFDFPLHDAIGGWPWGEPLEKAIEQALAPHWQYEEIK